MAFDVLKTSQALEQMEQIEKDIPITSPMMVYDWEARWVKLKYWLEKYGE